MENLKDLYDDFEDEDKARESITYSDKIIASLHYSSLLYGEILPSGITRLCDKEHLNVANGGSVFYDLGCGSGKLAFHVDFFLVSISDILGHFFLSSFSVFLQYSNLKKVIGVELAPSRIRIAYDAVCKLEKIKPELYTVEKDPSDGNKWVHLTETQSGPFLEFQCRSIFQESLQDANFVLLDTKIYPVQYNTCLELLETTLNGSCVASYENLNDMALKQERKFSFEQLKINEVRSYNLFLPSFMTIYFVGYK